MNQEIKKEWIAALRSGKYKQAKHVLNGDGAMCCLGVLCDVYMQRTEEDEWKFRNTSAKDPVLFQKYKTLGEFGEVPNVLPRKVTLWAGLETGNPDTGISMTHNMALTEEAHLGFSLAELNDGGLNFNQIADVIQFAL